MSKSFPFSNNLLTTSVRGISLDLEKTILYVGLNAPKDERILHCPLIKITPRPLHEAEIQAAYAEIEKYSHLIFTSKSAVKIFFDYLEHLKKKVSNKKLIAVGKATAQAIALREAPVFLTAQEETAEGILTELNKLSLKQTYFFWPHSALSRPLIAEYFIANNIRYKECIFYDTDPITPAILPDLNQIKEIIFTSPSTVDAFINAYGKIPWKKTLTTLGPITETHLKKYSHSNPA